MYKHTMGPDRSDAHLSSEEEAKKEKETRDYFQESAPKRHTKPSRSEYSSAYSDGLEPSDRDSIPELERFQSLESDPQKLECDGSGATEEYVETKYYEGLDCVDRQHHTTGTGFIKMEEPREGSFVLGTDAGSASACQPAGKGNPATNEWIPAADPVIPVSAKPNRSDA